jgi:hypothetical protein
MPTIPEAADTTTSSSHNHGNDAEDNDNSQYLCASPIRYKAKASTLPPPEHSAPGAKRTPCTLPDIWQTDPRILPHKELLMDVMSRIHDWSDLFDMVSTGCLALMWLSRIAYVFIYFFFLHPIQSPHPLHFSTHTYIYIYIYTRTHT